MRRSFLLLAALLVTACSDQAVVGPHVGSPAYAHVAGDGSGFAYVANNSESSVSVIGLSTNTVVKTVGVGPLPHDLAITPDGGHVYVANQGTPGTVSVIETAGNTIVGGLIPVGTGPRGIAVRPGGAHVYVTNQTGSTVSVIRTDNNTVAATIDVNTEGVGQTNPFGVAFTPDGAFAYVTNPGSNSMAVIDAASATFDVVDAITGFGATGPSGDGRIFDAVMTPDGDHVWVTNRSEDLVTIVSTSTNTIVGTVDVTGELPFVLAITPDGEFVYVANLNSGDVSVIEVATLAEVDKVSVGPQPQGIAVTPDGEHVYVTVRDAHAVKIIETGTNTVVPPTISTGIAKPVGIAITPATPEQQLVLLIADVAAGVPDQDKGADVIAKAQAAVAELSKTPPDNQAAVGNIEGAVGDLEVAVQDGLAPAVGNPLMDGFAAVARQLAMTAIDDAIERGGDASKIDDAQDALDAGDELRALPAPAFKDAVNKYKDALANAEGA